MLRQIEPFLKADAACAALVDFIKNHKLAPGSPLPAESELATSLGVSRVVIREAVSELKALGIVERQHGVGLRVGTCDLATPLARPLKVLSRDPDGLLSMMDLRISLEVGTARMYFPRILGELHRPLREIFGRMKGDHEPEDAEAIDCEFHHCLVSVSPLAAQINQVISEFFQTELKALRSTITTTGQSLVEGHHPLMEAMHREDLESFVSRLVAHLQEGRTTLLNTLNGHGSR